MVLQDVGEGIAGKAIARLQVEEFAKRESTQIVGSYDAVENRILHLETHHGRTGEDNLQLREAHVALAELLAPAGNLEHLIHEQRLASTAHERFGEVRQAVPLEIEVVHVDVQAALVTPVVFLCKLYEESSFADTTCPLDTNQALIPINFVHQVATDRRIGVRQKVVVSLVESFHFI